MGLDMFAYATKNKISAEIDFNSNGFEVEELFYWRKHHDLHGWMENLYHEKGGQEEFNCVNMLLTKEDLLRLAEDINENYLPPTIGFFFGNNPPDEDSNKKDKVFIDKALKAIDEGKQVFYSSWW